MSEKFWTAKYSEVYLFLFWSFVAAFIVEIVVIVPILISLPKLASALIGAGGILIVPLYIGGRIARRWKAETPEISRVHPFLFIRKVRSLKRSAYLMEVAVIVVTVALVVCRNTLEGLSSGVLLYLVLLELWPVELVFLLLQLSFRWAPEPFDALRASLLSETDPEREPVTSVLDDSIAYFNRISMERIGLALARNLSLDILLFGSITRSLRITMLLDRFENRADPDCIGFIMDISNIAKRPVSEILEKPSFSYLIAKNKGTILGVLGVLIPIFVALSPLIIPYFVNPIIFEWSQLFH